jgi:hypothetical protein
MIVKGKQKSRQVGPFFFTSRTSHILWYCAFPSPFISFITFEDMKGLLGAGDEGDDAFHEMWDSGVRECHCPLECITYDDFLRVMKGQTRDTDGSSRLSNRRLSMSTRRLLESNALEAVPEGYTSPNSNRLPRKSVVMLDMAIPQLPFLTTTHPGTEKNVDIGFPSDFPCAPLKRLRSRSLEAASEDWTLYETPTPPPPSPFSEAGFVIRSPLARKSYFAATDFSGIPRSPLSPRRASAVLRLAMDELNETIKDDKKTPLVVNRALYRKHREMRQSVLLASKMFDEKRQERRFSELKLGGLKAGLVMRRESVTRPLPTSIELGARTEHRRVSMPSAPSYVPHPLLSEILSEGGEAILSDPADVPMAIMTQSEQEQMHLVEEASRRGGRPRRQRKKTHSDMSQMMKGF